MLLSIMGKRNISPLALLLISTVIACHNDRIGYIEQKHATCIITRIKIVAPTFLCNLMELIEYHHLLGVSHLYIVDDCSPVVQELHDVLRYYRWRGIVTPFTNVQRPNHGCATQRPDERRLGHLMFQRHARHACTWVTYLDLDEYLTAWNHTGFSLERLLEQHGASAAPFYRLPWWNVGSDGLETRPKALVIDSYKGGQLQPQHHKTFAKSAECLDFNYTLHPQVLRPDEFLPVFNMKRREYTERESIHPFEMRSMTFGPADSAGTADVPATSSFIKHFMYMSWEEFRVQRANYTYHLGCGPTRQVAGGQHHPPQGGCCRVHITHV